MASSPLQVVEWLGARSTAKVVCPKHDLIELPGWNLLEHTCGNPCRACSEVCVGLLDVCCPWRLFEDALCKSSWPDILCSKFISVSRCNHSIDRLLLHSSRWTVVQHLCAWSVPSISMARCIV